MDRVKLQKEHGLDSAILQLDFYLVFAKLVNQYGLFHALKVVLELLLLFAERPLFDDKPGALQLPQVKAYEHHHGDYETPSDVVPRHHAGVSVKGSPQIVGYVIFVHYHVIVLGP